MTCRALYIPGYEIPGHRMFRCGISPGGMIDPANPDTTPLSPLAVTFTSSRTITVNDFSILPNFVQHGRSFADGLAGYDLLSGAAATLSGGAATITGASLYRIPSADPVAPWVTVTATVSARAGEVGVALVKDAANHLVASYDGAAVHIHENGTLRGSATIGSVSTPFTISIVQTGASIGISTDRATTHCLINGVSQLAAVTEVNYREVAVWNGYRPGLRNVSGTNNYTRLQSGVCGGCGMYNAHIVTYEDGSPYMLPDGRCVWTTDLASYGNYPNSHAVTFAWDIANNSIEYLGVFFYTREPVLGGAAQWHGMNDPRAIYTGGRFSINWPLADDENGNQNPIDHHVWRDSVFGMNVFAAGDMAPLDIVATVYDCKRWRLPDGSWRMGGGRWVGVGIEGGGAAALHPWFGSGTSATSFQDELFTNEQSPVENPNFWPLRGQKYYYQHHTGYGVVLDMDGAELGAYPFPTGGIAGNTNCFEMVPWQKNNRTDFFVVQCDNTERDGPYSHGNLRVFTTATFTTGYELPRYQAPVLP